MSEQLKFTLALLLEATLAFAWALWVGMGISLH